MIMIGIFNIAAAHNTGHWRFRQMTMLINTRRILSLLSELDSQAVPENFCEK